MSSLITREGYSKVDPGSVKAEYFGASGYLGSTFLEARERALEIGDSIDFAHVVMRTLCSSILARTPKRDETVDGLVEYFKERACEDGDCCVVK